jgi:hypothetical protein
MGSILREVRIHCPQLLTDRFKIIDVIKENGGSLEAKIYEAQYLLAECNDGMEWYSTVLHKRRSDSHVVDKKWLYDSVASGTMLDPALYYPSYIGESSKASTNSRPKKPKVKTNERQ